MSKKRCSSQLLFIVTLQHVGRCRISIQCSLLSTSRILNLMMLKGHYYLCAFILFLKSISVYVVELFKLVET